MSLNSESKIPKYKQIVSAIEETISIGSLKKDDKLPSLNISKTNLIFQEIQFWWRLMN